MKVYKHVKRDDAIRSGGKIVGTRWVDIAKAGECKSRLVAQEFGKDCDRDDLFASTPPLIATKLILSDYCSRGVDGPMGRKLMILDIKSAFLYGEIEELIFVELPPEDPLHGQGYVGQLSKAMYGTRTAPQVWNNVVRDTLTKLGFPASTCVPTLSYHQKREIRLVAHVDGFLISGRDADLNWRKKAFFDMKW